MPSMLSALCATPKNSRETAESRTRHPENTQAQRCSRWRAGYGADCHPGPQARERAHDAVGYHQVSAPFAGFGFFSFDLDKAFWSAVSPMAYASAVPAGASPMVRLWRRSGDAEARDSRSAW